MKTVLCQLRTLWSGSGKRSSKKEKVWVTNSTPNLEWTSDFQLEAISTPDVTSTPGNFSFR